MRRFTLGALTIGGLLAAPYHVLADAGSGAAVPGNDNCDTAESLVVNAPFKAGNNANANLDKICDSANATSNGVFYTWQGTGNVMSVSTCDSSTLFPTALYVSEACGSSCIPNDDPGFAVPCTEGNGKGAMLLFDSKSGTSYHAQVAGRTSNDVGLFFVQVKDYPGPSNDRCQLAERLIVTGKDNPNFKLRSTKFATKDDRCGNKIGRGVWFFFEGTGNPTTISTCHLNSTFAHNLIVQQACNSTSCISTETPSFVAKCSSNEFGVTETFDSVQHQIYYVFVEGINTKTVGDFAIAVYDYAHADHDQCTDPAPLKVNDGGTVGNTAFARLSLVDCAAPANDLTGRGQWYLFSGNGRLMTVTTCHASTNITTQLIVVEECDTQSCLVSTNTGIPTFCSNPYGSSYTFDSKSRSYRVMVSSPNTAIAGQYAIAVYDYPPPANDMCSKADGLLLDGTPVMGLTINATLDSMTCPNIANTIVAGRGVWYVVSGNGRTIELSTCFGETDYATEIEVFQGCSGDCVTPIATKFIDLSCSNKFGKKILFQSQKNVYYQIMVHGTSPQVVGHHRIAATQLPAPANDFCENAINLLPDGTKKLGTTVGASAEDRCGLVGAEQGVWYVVPGNDKIITVSTCTSETDFSANIDVRLNCGKNCTVKLQRRNGCSKNGLAAEVSWQSFSGFSYYIFVSGPVTGSFGIYAVSSTTFSPTPAPGGKGATKAPSPTPVHGRCPGNFACTSLLGRSGRVVKFGLFGGCWFSFCTTLDALLTLSSVFTCGGC